MSAFASRKIRQFEVEGTVSISLQFESGALGTFLLSSSAASSKNWEMTSGENPAYPHFPAENCWHFAGTNGSLDFPSMRARTYRTPDERSAAVAKALPDFALREIRGITFDDFMDLATRCMFSITFGEGFDGYFSHPMQQGGVGFAVFNERFFPSKDLAERENLFASPNDIIARIGGVMRRLATDEGRYNALNASWLATIDSLYDQVDYRRRIGMQARGEFELHPSLISARSLS